MAEKKRDIKVQTPGEVEEKQLNDESAQELDNVDQAILREAEIEAEVQRRLKAIRRKEMEGKKPTAQDLPEQAEINPDKINRAVLSKDGWVVPTGKIPAQHRGFMA